VSTIRERDAEDWSVSVPEDEADESWVAIFDRHALLIAGDALADLVANMVDAVTGDGCGCGWCVERQAERTATLAAWKAATG